jgi:formylglycine-generating enzyme required for sulfatase activity
MTTTSTDLPRDGDRGRDPLERLASEFLQRRRRGEPVTIKDYADEHPGLAADIRALFPLVESMEEAARSAPPGGDGYQAELLERLGTRGPGWSRYEVLGEAGRGGQGAVLEAWDEDLMRTVAMKVLHDGSGRGPTPVEDATHLGRFLEEAQVTGQLDHPGIVPVHELGLDSEGRVYFTMKLVQGRDLKAVFECVHAGAEGWTRTRALTVMLKVCDAMAYAHSKGVLHRDLKPGNVMVGEYGEVYVMDWGLARLAGRDDSRDVRVRPEVRSQRREQASEADDSPLYTMDGDVVGTPAYMSPEQARGDLDGMGPRSDVYAVGAMFYHLLTGHTPYVHPGESTSSRDVWKRLLAGPPVPIERLAPDAPAELVAICERAMARDPARRYADMGALAGDLSAYLEGRVVSAFEAGAWAEARKWVRRNTTLALALTAAVVLLVVGLVVSLTLRARAESETAKVLRLSDLWVLQQLKDEADELWPAHPERIPDLRAWLERARALAANLPEHRRTLLEMRRGTEHRGATAPLLRAGPDRGVAGPDPGRGGRWSFGTFEEQWQHDTLVELVEDLEGFEAGLLAQDAITAEHSWSIPRRLAFARELEAGFTAGGDYAAAWAAALPSIRDAYPGLHLTPQLGLLPIGPDPDSQLWEFAHLMTGAPAARAPNGRLILTEHTGAVLVLLPGGCFWMGAQGTDPTARNFDEQAQQNDLPPREVALPPFFLSKYELTQGQWLHLTGRNPSRFGPHNWDPDWLETGEEGTRLHPVEQVGWRECLTWLSRAGLAAPSEAEWEYGARGGTTTPWYTGEQATSLGGHANLSDLWAQGHGAEIWPSHEAWLLDGATVHAPVGRYAPNPFGLHDVAGNLWELCVNDPGEGSSQRAQSTTPFYRGAGFNNPARSARSACRLVNAASIGGRAQGIRPARAIAP